MKNPGTVQFLLNGSPIQIDFHTNTNFSPTTTLLQYLRGNSELTGTKEGCAEGDCGACTVVLVDPKGSEKAAIKAVDSCLIFLPMIHGKGIITVEQVGKHGLHPVQKSMVDLDGSQCGYCTPGFVMSLYALQGNHTNPDHEVIADALTGNLCRCTGYRSIVDAALLACKTPQEIVAVEACEQALLTLPNEPLAIVGETQKYFQPHTLEDALRLKNMYPSSTVINGATDIALRVTKNHELIEEIIDLSKVRELQILDTTHKFVTLGAGVSLEDVKSACQPQLPALYSCLKVFGSLQIRHLATLGGNIISASPIGDTPPVLMAYGATVNLANHESTRSVPITEFITGYRDTMLEPNEILVSITVPIPVKAQVTWYKISKRKDLDISSVSGGFYLKLDRHHRIEDIFLFYGGMAAKTSLAEHTGKFLKGKRWSKEIIDEACVYLDKDFSPISDARASVEGRKIMSRNLLWKLWTDTNAIQ